MVYFWEIPFYFCFLVSCILTVEETATWFGIYPAPGDSRPIVLTVVSYLSCNCVFNSLSHHPIRPAAF